MNKPAHLSLRRLAVGAVAVTAAVFLLLPMASAGDEKKPSNAKAAPAAEAAKPKPESKPKAAQASKPADKAAEKESQAKAKAAPNAKPSASRKQQQKANPGPKQPAELETRTYKVAADFFRVSADRAATDPFAAPSSEAASVAFSPKKALETIGITFGPGASAAYNVHTLQLTVRNTVEQLDLIAMYVAHIDAQREKQVHIIWEMIEVEHADFSDWLFDNRLDTDGTALREWAQEKINNGDGGIIETALVTARSGQRAKAESIHEFIYPTEFDPPEIPNEVELKGNAKAPITAVSPTAYETRNVGTTIEVDPVIGADNTTIDLNLAPEKVELDGYTIWPHEDIDPLFKQRMPTFYTMRITTQVTLTSGRYAFLGTLRPLNNEVEDIEDPIVLSFVRADVGVVPLAEPWGVKADGGGKKKGGH
jgi:type II secretory pathway component GspD/PulD (secretin)